MYERTIEAAFWAVCALAILGVGTSCVSGSKLPNSEDDAGASSCPDGGTSGGGATSDPTCNGVDDDCDGKTDEDCPCKGGGGKSDESCNGKDDDCDGKVDEKLQKECGKSSGPCGVGTKVCTDGSWSECKGGGQPTSEECNGFDDDCDGKTDELLKRTCGTNDGVCKAGSEKCTDGSWGSCKGRKKPEVKNEEDENEKGNLCDKKDNDCDGRIDENCSCKSGATRVCGTNTGACEKGKQTCGSDGTWGECSGQVGPKKEVCDNKDNDCNGKTDEGLKRDCGTQVGVCRKGTEECVSGQWSNCDAKTGTTERCDGKDNNCDGSIDENLKQKCSLQVGVCKGAKATCNGGKYPSCGPREYGTSYESPESTCGDQEDNDCDGDMDCEDSDCGGEACSGSGTECKSSSCTETACLDGNDNDGDGDPDCADSDCSCPSGSQCDSSTGACEENDCADSTDNDGDQNTDCNDSDCDGLTCEKNPCQDDGRVDICQNNSCTTSGLLCP